MMRARKPMPNPASTAVYTRAREVPGVTSPSPRVKKVVQLRYRSVKKSGVPVTVESAEPVAQWRRAKPVMRKAAHILSRSNNEKGPKKLRQVSRCLPENSNPANFFQRNQVRR